MRKAFLFLLFLTPLFANGGGSLKPKDITYDWLIEFGNNNSGYTDHIPVFRQLFLQIKGRKNLLEFRPSVATKYFLDSCNKVVSMDFITKDWGPEWMQSCLQFYETFPQWTPLAYFTAYPGETATGYNVYKGTDRIYEASQWQYEKRSKPEDGAYLAELNSLLANLAKTRRIDIAFVDEGIFLRGDVVQLLFNKVPVIVAHDTWVRVVNLKEEDIFGFTQMSVPENYEEIFFPTWCGTTVWIQKEDAYQGTITGLKGFAQQMELEREQAIANQQN